MSRIPARYRKAVYIAAAVLGGASIAFGFVAPDVFSATVERVVTILRDLATLFAAVLALGNLTPDE